MAESLRLDLLRHGEVLGGARFRGRRDDPLSPEGEQQVRAALADLVEWGGKGWDGVVSSPLARCRVPAERLAEAEGLPLRVLPELAEMDFGDWEGRTAGEIERDDPERLAAFWADPWGHSPPGGEELAAFAVRVVSAFDVLRADPPGHRLVVFTHGGVLRLLLMQLLGLPREGVWRWRVDPAARLRLTLSPPSLLRYEGLAP